MYKMKLFAIQIFSGLVLASSLYSNDVNEEQLVPGCRPIEASVLAQIQHERASEGEWTSEATVDCSSADRTQVAISSEYPDAAIFSSDVFYTTHNGAYHNPLSVTSLGGVVHLEDGSVWNIADGDHYKTLNWYTNDLIVLTPNHDWFTTELFRMTNQSTNVSVRCNMALGPIYHGLYTHWIVGINYYTQEIHLEDGSIWQVTGFDSSIFSKWLLNDTIVIGVNDGYLNTTKPNILIDVNTLTFVRAICIW